MQLKNHELLKSTFNGTIDGWLKQYSEIRGLGNYPTELNQRSIRESDIHCSLGLVELSHLGCVVVDSPKDVLNRGFDVVVDYFAGDWWHGNPRYEPKMNKSLKGDDLAWIDCFAKGLILGLIGERWSDVTTVCNWVEADLPYEYTEDYEEELVFLYKSLAAGLRTEAMPGLEDIESKILKCRTLRPRNLFQAWCAARSGDQAGFDKFLTKSLKHFVSNLESIAPPHYWVALHASNVCAASRRLGMKLPELPPELQAALMTRESLGLSPSRN